MMSGQEGTDKYFDAIMELQGVDEFKTMVQRLRKFQQNKEIHSIPNVTLPNYLWIFKRGGGVTTSINAFSEYLHATKIIKFAGVVKYFEFIPAYMPPDAHFSELTRLNNTISMIAGHYRHYRGIACIIIDEWIGHVNETNFYKLLDYIENHIDNILTVFCVHSEDKRIVEQIESSISSYMRFESIMFRFPDAKELANYMEVKYFSPCNFSLTEDAKLSLMELIDKMCAGKNFNGFVTIKQLSNDILYYLLTSNLAGKNISAEMLSEFNKNSIYIKRIKTLAERDSIIGFGQKMELSK